MKIDNNNNSNESDKQKQNNTSLARYKLYKFKYIANVLICLRQMLYVSAVSISHPFALLF